MWRALISLALATLLLSGCGYQLRGWESSRSQQLAEQNPALQLLWVIDQAEADLIAQQLSNSGWQIVPEAQQQLLLSQLSWQLLPLDSLDEPSWQLELQLAWQWRNSQGVLEQEQLSQLMTYSSWEQGAALNDLHQQQRLALLTQASQVLEQRLRLSLP